MALLAPAPSVTSRLLPRCCGLALANNRYLLERSSGSAGVFVEQRNQAKRERLVVRIRQEFEELPTLCLTLSQAARLFGVSEAACSRIFERLAGEGVLRATADGMWVRCDCPF